jgi:uncharacterized membrane protein YfcA
MDILLLIAIGFLAGTLGSMLGLGGGFLVVPALILIKAMDPKMATHTAIAVIIPTMLIALWRRSAAAESSLDWGMVATLAVGAAVGAVLGSWLVRPEGPVDGLMLRRIFSFVLLGLAALLYFRK